METGPITGPTPCNPHRFNLINMKSLFWRALSICAATIFLTCAASAQSRPNSDGSLISPASALKGTGKVAVVIIGSAAKSAWVITKFSAKHFAKPAAKFLLLKAPFAALKISGRSTKSLLPVAARLSKAYLKTKLPI